MNTHCNKISSHGLKLFSTNAFGLASKLGVFRHALAQLEPDVAIITETKFTSEKVSVADTISPGYHAPFRRDRTGSGGGVAIWVKSTLPVMQLEALSHPDHEMIWVSVESESKTKLVVCGAYRSGSASPTDVSLIEHLDANLPRARTHGAHLILAGDFNVHSKEWLGSTKTTQAGEALEDLCATHGLLQHVSEPTRGDNPLDLVMSTFQDPVTTSLLAPLGRSDHAIVISEFPSLIPRREAPTKRTVLRYNNADWGRMRAHFRNLDWSTIFVDDPDASCNNVTHAISLAVQRFVPSKVLTIRSSDPRWWTPECSQARAAKDKMWRRWRKNPTCDILKSMYIDAVNTSIRVTNRAMNSHQSRLRESLQNGSLKDKQWWSTMKSASGVGRCSDIPLLVTSDGSECVTGSEKAEAFGQFFSKKCSLGSRDLQEHDLDEVQRPPISIKNVHFRPQAVQRVLSRLDPSKATGPDGISARVLKECAHELSFPSCPAFRSLFYQGSSASLMEDSKCGAYPQTLLSVDPQELSASVTIEHHVQGNGNNR